jgi:hypothetical protein
VLSHFVVWIKTIGKLGWCVNWNKSNWHTIKQFKRRKGKKGFQEEGLEKLPGGFYWSLFPRPRVIEFENSNHDEEILFTMRIVSI